MNVHFSNKTNEWTTPKDFFEKLNNEFNFTLDPCCTTETAKCSKFYTQKENGLKQCWGGNKVFMNPPYGREIKYWIKKAFEESLKPNTLVVCLIPARTDTTYWHEYIFNKAKDIRFLKGRLKFGNSNNSAPFPSAVVVFEGAE
jgi:site-specific DNA-methyltransferase (adenine-specific)